MSIHSQYREETHSRALNLLKNSNNRARDLNNKTKIVNQLNNLDDPIEIVENRKEEIQSIQEKCKELRSNLEETQNQIAIYKNAETENRQKPLKIRFLESKRETLQLEYNVADEQFKSKNSKFKQSKQSIEAAANNDIINTVKKLDETLVMLELEKEQLKKELENQKELKNIQQRINDELIRSPPNDDSRFEWKAKMSARAIALKAENDELVHQLSQFVRKYYPKIAITTVVKPLERVNETRRQMNVDTEAEDPDDKQNTNETKKVQVFHFRKFLETLLNLRLSDNPYLKLNEDKHWPPHVELLLRSGVAEQHPTDSNFIRLTPFDE